MGIITDLRTLHSFVFLEVPNIDKNFGAAI